MFSNLRTNSQIYILHKEEPRLEVGSVVSVTQPVPKFPVTNFTIPQEMVVDVVVQVNGNKVTLQKLPSNLDIADQGLSGSVVITTSKEAMNNELNSLKQKSLGILHSLDYHKMVIDNCDKMLSELNPEFAEQKLQKDEINVLKAQVSEMAESMKELINQLKKK